MLAYIPCSCCMCWPQFVIAKSNRSEWFGMAKVMQKTHCDEKNTVHLCGSVVYGLTYFDVRIRLPLSMLYMVRNTRIFTIILIVPMCSGRHELITTVPRLTCKGKVEKTGGSERREVHMLHRVGKGTHFNRCRFFLCVQLQPLFWVWL